MKPEWRAFLTDAGAEFEDGMVAHFGNAERERRVVTTGDVICDLSHWGLIAPMVRRPASSCRASSATTCSPWTPAPAR
jgi:hypothetical protein